MKANIEKLDRIINGLNGGHLGTVELNVNNIKKKKGVLTVW